ncbi:hybrid sensor histidine kinase/response regulator [Methylophaga thiooxydans]
MTTHRWQQIADIYRQLGHYDEVGNLDDFLYKNQSADIALPKWLIATLGMLSFIALLSYLLKRHHNAKLTAQIRQQTESMKDELRERKALEATARHESLRLQTLLDNTIDSVITINQSGIIENYNKASVQLFGYQPDEVIGKNITMLMPASYRDQHKLGMARFLSTEETRTIGKPVEVEALHKSGNTFPIELTLSDFKWEQKHLFTGIARDISQQKAEQESLLKAKYEAERANNAKSEFLSSMSHELRTPLNGILGFSQLLLSDTGHPLNEKQRHNINQIIHSGKHLLSLINDVLELSEIESGRIKTSNDHVPIASVFEECQPLLQALAKQQNINIDFQDGTDAVVLANFTKLKQVFITLVNNAIKYNKTGGKVLVSASVQTHNSSLKLTITDTGKGISKDRQAQVFTPFERLGQEWHVEGVGIGLSVSKRLIEAMDGQIDFASAEGQGTSFWIELPLSNNAINHIDEIKKADGEQEISFSQRKTDTEVALPSKQILYIEDNPANIKLIEVFLSRFKHVSLETCETAEAGLEILYQRKPDLILMDINLPGISGIETAQKLQDTPEFADIPLIALTAAALEENSHAAQGLFTAYITKPVDFTLLARTLQPYL